MGRYRGQMNRRTLRAAILSLPLAIMLIAAAPVEPPSLDSRITSAAALVDANKNDEALAILDPLLTEAELPVDRGRIQGLRSFALARANRIPEARKAAEAAYAAAVDPTPLLLRHLFLLRAFDGDPDGAAQTLQLIAASNPKWLEGLPSDLVGQVLAQIRKDEARSFDVSYTLVQAGWAPQDTTIGDLDWLRMRVIQGLAKRERLPEAEPLVAGLINTTSLIRLAIDRRYQPLWPVLEKRLGPGADLADKAYVEAAKARFDASPDSRMARLGYAEALNIASREPEALKIADVAQTTEAMSGFADRELWLVNLAALLLADQGQFDAALARMAALNALPPAGRPSLAGTTVNEALLAESIDRPDATLAAVARAWAAGIINDYGSAYLATAATCALAQQGKAADAAAAAAPLIAKPDLNEEAYLPAMLCLGRQNDAAASVIRRLGDEAKRTDMLFALQPFLIADHPKLREKRERAAMRALKARPDVKAAFAKAGRDLPAAVSPPR